MFGIIRDDFTKMSIHNLQDLMIAYSVSTMVKEFFAFTFPHLRNEDVHPVSPVPKNWYLHYMLQHFYLSRLSNTFYQYDFIITSLSILLAFTTLSIERQSEAHNCTMQTSEICFERNDKGTMETVGMRN